MAANRTKTIEVMLPMFIANIDDSTTHTDSADTTIYIPETTSRVFLSVSMEVICHDTGTGAVDLSAWSLRGSCDAGSNFTTVTQGAAYANTGENMAHCFFVDMTAEFTTRFGTSATGTFRYGIYLDYASADTFNNVSAKLYITYQYDDTAHSTRVKTVRIPIESFNGRLSNTAQAVCQGTAIGQIPALDTFLPESSKVYRQIFAELWTNTLPSNAADCTLSLKVGSGGDSTAFGTVENTLVTPQGLRFLWDLTTNGNMTTDATHDIYANHEVASQSYFNQLGGWLTTTYEYSDSSSTTVMNSIITGVADGSLNVRTSGDLETFDCDLWVEEPETVTLKQSGIFVAASCSATSDTFSFGAGGQTPTGYTPTSGTAMAGMLTFMHRIDSGGNAGAGLTLARGRNVLTVQWYAATVDRIANVNSLLILNYTSGKHASGDGVHSHSTHWNIFPNSRATSTNLALAATVTPVILESNYWLVGVSPMLYGTGISGAITYFGTQCEILSGEKLSAGWADLNSSVGVAVNERLFQINRSQVRNIFKRWPTDTDADRLNIETARTWRVAGITAQWGMGMWVAHHSITYTISGTVSNYSGDGSGITVEVYRTDTGYRKKEIIGSLTTGVGGTFSMTWYDNVVPVFAAVRQDDTHTGRSADGVAI